MTKQGLPDENMADHRCSESLCHSGTALGAVVNYSGPNREASIRSCGYPLIVRPPHSLCQIGNQCQATLSGRDSGRSDRTMDRARTRNLLLGERHLGLGRPCRILRGQVQAAVSGLPNWGCLARDTVVPQQEVPETAVLEETIAAAHPGRLCHGAAGPDKHHRHGPAFSLGKPAVCTQEASAVVREVQ